VTCGRTNAWDKDLYDIIKTYVVGALYISGVRRVRAVFKKTGNYTLLYCGGGGRIRTHAYPRETQCTL